MSLPRWRQPDQIVRNAAQKFGIGRQLWRASLHALEFGVDEFIDVVVLATAGAKPGLSFKMVTSPRLACLVADQHGGFALALGFKLPLSVISAMVGVLLENRLLADVRWSVGTMRDNFELPLAAGLVMSTSGGVTDRILGRDRSPNRCLLRLLDDLVCGIHFQALPAVRTVV